MERPYTGPQPAAEDLEPYQVPTWFIDSDSAAVRHRAEQVAAGAVSDEERAARLFYAVRDGIRYDRGFVGPGAADHARRMPARGWNLG